MTEPLLPLVFSCSGCSNVAQLANRFAVRLDRAGLAEMSCIAGIGGDVPSIVRKALQAAEEGRPVLALDGCVLECTRNCLLQSGLRPTVHVRLHEWGVRKAYHTDVPPEQAEPLYERLVAQVSSMRTTAGAAPAASPGCGSAADRPADRRCAAGA
ncbi:putative zinc-binding protein [Caldimonas tepidiphila]|uniref:putative zinc-binding protein n=1 Tax=Caldimonas tepidiphila TaxID=2315841 RepID=UPI000E5ADC47|nr:putative zinc-binding protein [Caldimonas tepidiphila]